MGRESMVPGGSQECYRSVSEPDDLARCSNQPIISTAYALNGLSNGMDMGKAFEDQTIPHQDLVLFWRCGRPC